MTRRLLALLAVLAVARCQTDGGAGYAWLEVAWGVTLQTLEPGS